MPRGDKGTFEERIWRKISPEPNSGCWLWTGYTDRLGYGQTYKDGRVMYSHRATYEFYIGKVPDGLVLDHLCRIPCCANPAHLEPVTQADNVRRGLAGPKSHCRRGHPFDEANSSIRPNGSRACKQCIALNDRRPETRKRRRIYYEQTYKDIRKAKRAAGRQV